MTKSEALEWIGKQTGRKAYEDGGAVGTQCVELVSTYAGLVVGKNVIPHECGNGNVCSINLPKNFPEFFSVIEDLSDICVGDVLSLWSNSAIQQGKNLYGHTAIVCNVTEEKYSIIEQWAGSKTVRKNTKPKGTKPPTNYAVIGVCRPIFSDTSTENEGNIASDEAEIKKVTEENISIETPTENATNPYAEPTSNLKKGSRGEGVKWLQWRLIELKYDLGKGGADGIFGNCTDIAVRDFQKIKGLSVDGIVGKNTRAALKTV